MIRTTLLIVVSLVLLACAGCENGNLQRYKRIVNRANRFEVHRNGWSQAIVIPANDIGRFKDVITSGIEPETQRHFLIDTRIDIYFDDHRLGYLMIQGGKAPFANFNADQLNFGFRLTYRTGMWIGELTDSLPEKMSARSNGLPRTVPCTIHLVTVANLDGSLREIEFIKNAGCSRDRTGEDT